MHEIYAHADVTLSAHEAGDSSGGSLLILQSSPVWIRPGIPRHRLRRIGCLVVHWVDSEKVTSGPSHVDKRAWTAPRTDGVEAVHFILVLKPFAGVLSC